MTYCNSCKKRPKQAHFNSKWCKPCALQRRKRPVGTLTAIDKAWVRAHIGKMPISEIAANLGVSVSNIKRSLSGVPIWFKNGKYKNNPKLVHEVFAYYSKHGMIATKKEFPNVNVRCIVDRPKYYGVNLRPRQIRWKEHEIILAARMAGLVDGKRQAKIFNRPGANEGSIKSLWMKRFGHGGGNIHGMSEWMAKQILKPGYPVLKTRVWSKRKGQPERGPVRGLVLWCDMLPHLRRGTPSFIRNGVKTMAQFQRWLYQSKDPKCEILKILEGA